MLRVFRQPNCETEIGKQDLLESTILTLFVDQYVIWLDVSVDKALAVNEVQRKEKLYHHEFDLSLAVLYTLDHVVEQSSIFLKFLDYVDVLPIFEHF